MPFTKCIVYTLCSLTTKKIHNIEYTFILTTSKLQQIVAIGEPS